MSAPWPVAPPGQAPALDEDYHVHSTFSDGVNTVAENVDAAVRAGLRSVCLAEHVRASTSWLPEFVRAVGELRPPSELTVRTGAEATMLDLTGRLDLPADLTGIDLILIADHQFPAGVGAVDPAALRGEIADGRVTPADAVGGLVEATANAAATVSGGGGIVAHLFSVLPRIGLSEDDVPDSLLAALGSRLRAAGALVELNEKRGCPGPRATAALAAAGVPLVASSDSHRSQDIGQYRSVACTVGVVFPPVVPAQPRGEHETAG